MKILKVYKNDIGNGPGIRVSVWCSGCDHKCPECHNPETWAFNQGRELDEPTVQKILDLCSAPEISGLTITGGDPLHPANASGTETLVKAFKTRFPNKTVWVWTGYRIEELMKRYTGGISALTDVDVLVDGRYNRKLRNVMLPYSGSSNQRIIDVKRFLKDGVITEIDVNKNSRII